MKPLKTHITDGSQMVSTTKRDTDYLRFRPYHAFKAQFTAPSRWTVLWRIFLIVGAVAVLIFSGKLLLFAIT